MSGRDESRGYPARIYAGHLGSGRRTWKPELLDASEAAHSCEYVRADVASASRDALYELWDAIGDGLCNSGTPGFDAMRLGRAMDAANSVLQAKP